MRNKTCFRNFIKEYRFPVLLALIFSFLAFGTMLLYPSLTIDEEMSIFADSSYKPWIVQGRYGIQILNLLFSVHGRFVPVLWDVMAIVFWMLSGVILACALLFHFGRPGRIPLFAFLAYYGSLPFVMGEMLGFSMMSAQVGLGMTSAALAILYTEKFLEYSELSQKKYFILAVLFLFAGASIFQAILTLYVTALLLYCLQRVLHHKTKIFRPILTGAVISILALILYYICLYVIVYVIYQSHLSYIDSYIGWTEDSSIAHAAFMAIANVARVSFAITIEDVSIYGGYVVRTASILFILWSIYAFIKAKGKGEKPRILFLTVMTMFGPFSLYIAMGTYKTQGRMLLALPLVGAAALFYILEEVLHGKRLIRYAALIIAGYLLFLNARDMNTINYYSYLRYEQDRETAGQIMYNIRRLGYNYHKKAVVFIGAYKTDFNEGTSSSTIGASGSFFSWDDGNIGRMTHFMETEGYQLITPEKSQIQDALSETSDMKQWPQDGSIKETDDTIIVYLSAPTADWYITNGLK